MQPAHVAYPPSYKGAKYANIAASWNPISFGSNEIPPTGCLGPTNSVLAANASIPGKMPKVLVFGQNGGNSIIDKSMIDSIPILGTSGYSMALNPSTVEQQLPYSSMYAPITPLPWVPIKRPGSNGTGKTNYPYVKGGRKKKGTKGAKSKTHKGLDFTTRKKSRFRNEKKFKKLFGRKTIRANPFKYYGGYQTYKQKLENNPLKFDQGETMKLGLANLTGYNNQTGGFLLNPSSQPNCSMLTQAQWLNNYNYNAQQNGGYKPLTPYPSMQNASYPYINSPKISNPYIVGWETPNGEPTLAQKSYILYKNYANASNSGGKRKTVKNKKTVKNIKNMKNMKNMKNNFLLKQNGGVLGGTSGNPLFPINDPYKLSYQSGPAPLLTRIDKYNVAHTRPKAYNSCN